MNRAEVRLILREYAKALVVRTTGLITLQATSAGYRRASGSFLDDGFMIGMEITPSGFTKNPTGVITDVSDTDIEVDGGRTAQAAGANRSLVVGLPASQSWGVNLQSEMSPDFWHVDEEAVPVPSELLGLTAGGTVNNEGLHLFRFWGIPNTGDEPLEAISIALEEHFRPGVVLPALTTGEIIRIRGNPMPWSSSVRQDEERKRPFVTVTLPWRCYSQNPTT